MARGCAFFASSILSSRHFYLSRETFSMLSGRHLSTKPPHLFRHRNRTAQQRGGFRGEYLEGICAAFYQARSHSLKFSRWQQLHIENHAAISSGTSAETARSGLQRTMKKQAMITPLRTTFVLTAFKTRGKENASGLANHIDNTRPCLFTSFFFDYLRLVPASLL
jgi:hypothetical protein